MDELNVQSAKAFLLAPQQLESILQLHGGQSKNHKCVRCFFNFLDQASLLFSLKLPPILPPCCRGMDPQREDEQGSKAGAHRFAIFSLDFSPLLLHKKKRILDYLWHS